ncbi:MAG: hypothetical protein HC924_03235 [Synechococcaceae cyanobacterium SM2_3_2]|nr:hypothetical protein [Synechococcaceae cyanobacterium SM2_3_2]
MPNAIAFRLRLRHSDRISSRRTKRHEKENRGQSENANIPTSSFDLKCEGLAVPLRNLVNTAADDDSTGADTTTCTFREAIEPVNNVPTNIFGGCEITGGTIQFAPALANETITIANSPLPAITANVTISGPGADTLIISGEDQFRIFEIASINNPEVTIEKLTLTKGLATNVNSGAILSVSYQLLAIDSVTISNSTATGATYGVGQGGGIFSSTAIWRRLSHLSPARSQLYAPFSKHGAVPAPPRILRLLNPTSRPGSYLAQNLLSSRRLDSRWHS